MNLETEHSCTKQLPDSEKLLSIQNDLCTKLDGLKFEAPVEFIYNPLKYAKTLHETFIKKYFDKSTKKIMFLGMNPGPWGMCQTGIPFGEKTYVKEWFKISGKVNKPDKEHPKRKVVGLDCHRSEISGKKLWGFFQKLCKTPENFFKHSFIYNHCPLAFMTNTGKNITPPEIKDKKTKNLLCDYCDEALIQIIKNFRIEIIIGIGNFAKKSAIKVLRTEGIDNVKVISIPHPSPRNPKNILHWEENTLATLQEFNLVKYLNGT